MFEGTNDAGVYVALLERHMIPSRGHIFSQRSVIISAGQCQTSILHELQQRGFTDTVCVCVCVCACVLDWRKGVVTQ